MGSVGFTTPILPSWPFSLVTAPSPVMVIWVSPGAIWIGLPATSSNALPASSPIVPFGSGPNRAIARQTRAASGCDREISAIAQGQIERIAGLRQRARLRIPPCRAILRVGDLLLARQGRAILLRIEPLRRTARAMPEIPAC